MKIIRGKQPSAKKIVVYGPEGIGKSTFASRFPDPLFIDTEGSTKDMDVARFEAPSSWTMLLEQVRYVKFHPEICRTLVIDTADWAEMRCIDHICARFHKDGLEEFGHICARFHKDGLEEFGYGKGYVYVQEEFGRLLNLLEEIVGLGIHVVMTAHAKMRKFEQPDEMGAYDRWEMKLSKNVSPMVKEWADMVLFANYKTHVVKVDGKNKAQGGRRVIYTTHHSCWDAKNRYGLEDELPFEYSSIAGVMEESTPAPMDKQSPAPDKKPVNQKPAHEAEPVKSPQKPAEPQAPPTQKEPDPPVSGEQMSMDLSGSAAKQKKDTLQIDPRVPKALRDLMLENGISEWDLENVVEARGYVPAETRIWEYDTVNPGIVEGLLVPCWDQVMGMIREMREKQEIPFN